MTEAISYVGTYEDGSQLLIQIWPEDQGGNGTVTAAKRRDRWAVWGPPITLEEAP